MLDILRSRQGGGLAASHASPLQQARYREWCDSDVKLP